MPIIRWETAVQAPPERCFDLARSVDLHVDSSTEIAARAVAGRCAGLSENGDATVWSARFLGLRFAMETRVEDFWRPTGFRDVMTHGHRRRIAHLYRFGPLPEGGCLMSDGLRVEAPLPVPGQIAERVYLVGRMRHLVRRRLEHIKAVAEGDGWRTYLGNRSG